MRKIKVEVLIRFVLLQIIIRQFFIKADVPLKWRFGLNKAGGNLWRKIVSAFYLFKKLYEFDSQVVRKCRQCLEKLVLQGIKEVDINGTGDTARILYVLSATVPVSIRGFYDDSQKKYFFRFRVFPPENLNGHDGKIIVASLVNKKERIRRLREAGIDEKRIVTL